MENKPTISRTQKVVNSVDSAKAEKTAPATETASTTVLANSLPPTPVENKKGYNLFKNPQGKWELQLTRRGGITSKTVYETEDDAKEVVKTLGLDKK